jgi:hypothetical protein
MTFGSVWWQITRSSLLARARATKAGSLIAAHTWAKQ